MFSVIEFVRPIGVAVVGALLKMYRQSQNTKAMLKFPDGTSIYIDSASPEQAEQIVERIGATPVGLSGRIPLLVARARLEPCAAVLKS